MKKKLLMLLVVIVTMLGLCSIAAAQSDFSVTLQLDNPVMNVAGVHKEIDPGRGTVPVVRDGRTLVPIRAIVEEMGGTVGWEQSTQTVSLVYNNTTINFVIGSNVAIVDRVQHMLDVAPDVINGRTMLPIRFVAEKFNFDVKWIDASSEIVISKLSNIQSSASQKMTVHFIDVGQGDSIFVQLPNGETLLIDAGPVQDVVNSYINGLGYDRITYVVATHPDADHIGGMPQVLDEFTVGKFYMPDKVHTTQLFEKMLDSLENNGCAVNVAQSGVVIADNGQFSVKIVAPVKSYSDNNNCSAVVMLEYDEISFLFTGDIEAVAESDIINSGADIDADVLKIAHHGSNSSTSEEFLDKTSPEIAVISVGGDNKYGHPSTEVVSRLNTRYIPCYTTAQSGTILITSDGKS
ncbi:MAG: MBL fold metallo-hydrolase, partial [Clostridia bacterium]|nr:MBL fold metallo-hydrolase [Clostridia bacterium]